MEPGLMQTTRWQILTNLKKQGRMSVDELARSLQLTPNCIRQHLTVLERDTYVVSTPDRVPMGRPRQLYCLTRDADDLFPKNYHNLLDWLFTEISEQEGQSKVNSLLNNVAKRIGVAVAEKVKDEPFEQKVEAVSVFLNSMGAITEWKRENGGCLLFSFNCTYMRISSRHKEICCLDHGLISVITGAKVEHLESIANGDPRCSYRLMP